MKKSNRTVRLVNKKQSKQTVRIKSAVKAGKDGFLSFHDAVKQGKI
jgi:hypothetical protein